MKMVGIGIIGAGQIGSAIARILVEAGRFHVMASRRNLSSIRELEKIGVKITTSNIEVASNSDIVFICVKPYKVIQVVREISSHLDGKILISVAAAISIRQLSEAAPKAKIVRAMPNIALMVKTSFTAYTFGPNL
ncbi:MAG: NAD(P)-binding domain-containing protein, partial [Nitrososphaerota archaeon]